MTQLFPYLFTIGAILLMMFVWVAVQMAWKRTFPEASSDEDVLANRTSCGSCSHDGQCDMQSGDHAKKDDCDQHSEMVRQST